MSKWYEQPCANCGEPMWIHRDLTNPPQAHRNCAISIAAGIEGRDVPLEPPTQSAAKASDGDPRVDTIQKADYGLITALRDELTALRAALTDVDEIQLGTDDIRYYYRGRLRCQDGSQVTAVCACANEMGQQPALNVTRDLIAAWKPRHVFLVGIAGGFPGRGCSYGDVVVPLRVHYYEPGKLVAPRPGEVQGRLPRWRTFPVSAKLSAAVEAVASDGSSWTRGISTPRPDGGEAQLVRILRDELATGEEVWASLDHATVQEILGRSDKILAVENEAGGFLSAVHESPHSSDALVVKVLSDLVEGKDDRWRAFAASTAAAFTIAVIEKLGSRWAITSPAGSSAAETPFVQYAAVGEDLESRRLCADFFSGTHDLVVWEESMEGPTDTIAIFRHDGQGYVRASMDLGDLMPYATRIHAVPGGVVVIQERSGVSHLDVASGVLTRGVRMPLAADSGASLEPDPIIRAEAVHPTRPVVVLGTDYGMLVAWDWARNAVLFRKRYFPREEIAWMSALAIDERRDVVLFIYQNVLHDVSLADGALLRRRALGEGEEETTIAFHAREGLLAVGGVMYTRLYKVGETVELIGEIQNPLPMVRQMRFSPNGRLLAVLAGMGIGGNAMMVIDVPARKVVSRHGQMWAPKNMSHAQWQSLTMESVSFSSDGHLLAVGEGGRVEIYSCPAPR